MTLHRRTFLSTAAVAAAASLPGCMIVAPAVASICKAAPYIPAEPDAALFETAKAFHGACNRHEAEWKRYQALPAESPEAVAMVSTFDDMYDEWASLSDACYAISPASPAGAAALLGVILVRDADFIDEAAKKPLRIVRDALAAMAQS